MACAFSSGGENTPYRFVSQVMSRHLKGRSIGVNLTPDKRCNYRCVYCEVDRSIPSPAGEFKPDLCRDELMALLDTLQRDASLEDFRYIALAGEGEPTSCVHLPKVIEDAVDTLKYYGMSDTRVVLMTNGTCLHTPWAKEALGLLRQAEGEIWIKLDAGTQEHMNVVNGTFYPIETLTEKIVSAGSDGEIVLQSVLVNSRGLPLSLEEISAYVDRVKTIRARGACIKRVQVCTLTRPLPADSLTPLNFQTLSAIAERVEGEAGVRVDIL